MKKIFARMQSNGWADEENFCTDTRMQKIFAWMQSNGYMSNENF